MLKTAKCILRSLLSPAGDCCVLGREGDVVVRLSPLPRASLAGPDEGLSPWHPPTPGHLVAHRASERGAQRPWVCLTPPLPQGRVHRTLYVSLELVTPLPVSYVSIPTWATLCDTHPTSPKSAGAGPALSTSWRREGEIHVRLPA